MTSAFYEDEKITEDQQSLTARQALSNLMPLLVDHRRGLSFCLTLLVAATLLSVAWPVLLKNAIDGSIRDGDFPTVIIYAVAIALIQIVTIGLQFWQRLKLEIIGQEVMLKLKQRLFDHILSLDVSFFDRNPVGRLMARVETDTESLRLLFTNTVVMLIGDLVLIFGIYGVMAYYNWRLALTLFAFIPLTALMMWFYNRLTAKRFLEVRKKMAEVTAALTEFLHSMSVVQIFHRGSYARRCVFKANKDKFVEDRFVNLAVVIFFNTVFFFEYVKIGLVLFLGAIWNIEFGVIIMFIILVWREFEPIFHTSEQLGNIQKAIAGGRRIFALLAEQPKIDQPVRPIAWSKLEKGIRFENVTFSYNNDNTFALEDVSFEIPVGRRVALAGVTGGGKSTIVSLLLRMYDPQKGRITVDDIDIREISTNDVRRRFALVLQDILLFPGDVKANIDLEATGVTYDRMIEAARATGVDKFVSRLRDTYATHVSEKGSNFSRGERQLLSFARALVTDPDVLLLDEATSSVDPETEQTIQRSLKRLMKGRTSLVIAHRLETILDVDQILVLRGGRIVERGTHTELILKDGYYSKLFHLQFKHRNEEIADA